MNHEYTTTSAAYIAEMSQIDEACKCKFKCVANDMPDFCLLTSYTLTVLVNVRQTCTPQTQSSLSSQSISHLVQITT